MRICVISYHSSPLDPPGSGNSGGMNICISHLYQALSPFCEIDIFTYGSRRNTKLNSSIDVIYLDCQNLRNFADKVISYHNSRRYDIIHTHYWLSGVIGLLTMRKIKIPWIHSLHTVEMLKGIKRDQFRIEVEEEIIRVCNFIISPTHKEAFAIKEIYPKARIITIPHGVDVRTFTPSIDGHSKLLFVGRIDPIKGLDLLIDALRLLKYDIELDVIGGASKGEHYFESIKTYGDGLPVRFLGPIEHTELNQSYMKSGMLIVPSYYESFGLVALEAMASGRPVIGFDDTGLSETVGADAGILVKRNAQNLAQAITSLIDNRELRHNLGLIGRKKALGYKWENIAQRYLMTYEKIIKG
ncbi:MAG: glycosyltransferase [Candidatus Cloacimonadota bacterium]|nr:MAG: glycosyltransferase [Candidatus Cloacimonadota bacterium]